MENKRAVLLVHGFGGTPEDFGKLAEVLAKQNMDIISPVLPGQVDEISPYDKDIHTAEFYKEWLNSIISNTVNKYGKKPVLAGFSMGGTLSALCVDNKKIEKLVLVAPFFSLPILNTFIRELSESIKNLLGEVPKFSKGQINDKEGYSCYKPGSMKVDLNAFLELEKLADKAYGKASEIDVNTLVLHSVNDRVASFSKMQKAFEGNHNIKIVEYERSNHILLYDHDREDAVNRIVEFITKPE